MSLLNFQLDRKCPGSRARAARFFTLHGEVQTPVFMPVGTQATVKSQTVEDLSGAGSRVLLANTYHLMLRPGAEVFRRFGGIHRFMNWNGPVLTDSGGFQIFSLPHSRSMNEEGARFQSYLDGTSHLLSPEVSIAMQRAIGSDIMMVLDQCIRSTAPKAEAQAAMELTHRWALRSLKARGDSPQSLFAIVQGACFEDLRKQSAETLTALPFDGFAIGGLAVGETKQQREDFTEMTAVLLPENLPRYLMGVGTPLDILEAVYRGVDMFDCIIPSQIAQRGGAFTSQGRLQLRRTQYKFADEPLDPHCPCGTCAKYSKAYLHHLHKTGEILGWKLITTHNLTFYHRLMSQIRASLLEGKFVEYYKAKRLELSLSDNEFEGPSTATRVRNKHALELGDYQVAASPKGFYSIRQKSSGETMHSVTPPSEEAHTVYIEQSDLQNRLREEVSTPLVVWDVGLGAATNAMAAVHCYEEALASGVSRALRLISFEIDLDPLRLALKHPGYFAHLRHGAPHAVLKEARYSKASLMWELVLGDFEEQFHRAPAPDIIFYDPFSFKTDSQLWRPSLFKKLFDHCIGKRTHLYTYSASTAVRASLLSAGFFVGEGVATGPKESTTIAYNYHPDRPLLGSSWLERWDRSSAKFPMEIELPHHSAFELRIRSHAQF